MGFCKTQPNHDPVVAIENATEEIDPERTLRTKRRRK